MSTIPELFSSIRDDLSARYRSPIWGPALFSLIACHWKIVLYLALESPKAADAIAFVESNASARSIALSLLYASVYVVAFPWLELSMDWVSRYGRRKRNEYQTGEREREIGRRKVIAQREQKALEIELKNIRDQSKIADIELAKQYQNILSGENFNRWLTDLQLGPLNHSVNNVIVSYLQKVDSVEGKFINAGVEAAHQKFVSDLSTLNSAINDGRSQSDEDRKNQIANFSRRAQESQKKYRALVRELLEI